MLTGARERKSREAEVADSTEEGKRTLKKANKKPSLWDRHLKYYS